MQWTADTTEHAHITEIRVPGWSGNNQSYNPQICMWLNCSEKHRNFNLALSIHELQLHSHHTNPPEQQDNNPSGSNANADDAKEADQGVTHSDLLSCC
jgi:hypothetical protein